MAEVGLYMLPTMVGVLILAASVVPQATDSLMGPGVSQALARYRAELVAAGLSAEPPVRR